MQQYTYSLSDVHKQVAMNKPFKASNLNAYISGNNYAASAPAAAQHCSSIVDSNNQVKKSEFICHHPDCHRVFYLKTSLPNHLKAQRNRKSGSSLRIKREKGRAAAEAAAEAAAAQVAKNWKK